jgi:hypothetical protein
VLAAETLDLGDGGAGVLSSAFGVGALAGALGLTLLLRRSRLAPILVATLGLVSLAAIVLGVFPSVPSALVVLAIVGASRSLLVQISRILLQRSVRPAGLGAAFGVMELLAGVGRVAGSVVTQVLIALAGVSAALIGIGTLFALLLTATRRSLRAADGSADVPVVAISLLQRLATFAPLADVQLEAVARTAVETPVRAGEVVAREGTDGVSYYAVASGVFEVTIAGDKVRTLSRGDGFGEVALLADIPRTATVTAREPGTLLAIERDPFVTAITSDDQSHHVAWTAIRSLTRCTVPRVAATDGPALITD